MDEARGLVSDQTLWPLVRDFLWDFAQQVHGSWLEGLVHEPSVATRETGDRESLVSRLMPLHRVKAHVLAELGVSRCFHTFPKGDWSRLLLLDGLVLESLVKWLGALACTEVLRRVTNGATVRELKAALPGIYPEVFGYTMYFGSLEALKFGSLDVGKLGGVDIEKVGCGILLQSLSSLSAPLVQRLKLKLPKSMTGMEPPNLETSKLPNLQTSISKLLKLKFPEAYKLCCS